MRRDLNSLVLVTPVFEDREASSKLFLEVGRLFGRRVRVVAIDDGSVRMPLDASVLEQGGVQGTVLRLRRNVGHQRAIAIGLHYASQSIADDDRIVVLDSDGEDRPESIQDLLAALQRPEVDVVVAQRKSRVESLQFRIFYRVYRLIFGLLSGRRISFGNFMAMKAPGLRRLTAMQELWLHVAGCVLNSKLRVTSLPLDRGPRYAGKSKMNFVGLALHGFRALMVFAEDVLVRVGIACTLVAAVATAGALAAIVLKIVGYATPGWFSIVLGILFLVFLQTGALTLMSLMLSGVMRGSLTDTVDYRDLIDVELHAERTEDEFVPPR